MKQKTIKNLWKASNAIMTTEEDGLDYLSGIGLIIAMILWIILLIVFGSMLGGL